MSSSLDQLAALAAGALQAEECNDFVHVYEVGKAMRLDHDCSFRFHDNVLLNQLSSYSAVLNTNSNHVNESGIIGIDSQNSIEFDSQSQPEPESSHHHHMMIEESQPLSQESIKSNLSEYGYNF